MKMDRPTVTLPQGTLVGTVLSAGLPSPVDAWLGVPYATPPVGDLRFREAQPVPASTATFDADKYGFASPGKPLIVVRGKPALVYSEDCLTANIFRPKTAASSSGELPEQPEQPKLPVMLYIHGGAFNRGTSSMHNTASFVAHAAAAAPFVAVSFNYRVGALGFLPSALSAKEGALNLGLKDQKLMMRWVRDHIAEFGGDPARVTLMGLSAGAHSIGHHIFDYTDGVAPLFNKAIIQSGAATSRAVRPPNAPVHEAQFRAFLDACGVPADLPEEEVFPFLRRVPTETVQAAQIAVFDAYNPSLAWAFQPVVDGDVIPRAPLDTYRSGRYHKVPVLTGFQHNEGSLYVNKAMAASDEFTAFFRGLLPLLSDDDIATVDKLYPDPLTIDTSAYKETRPGCGAQYARVEAAYGHYAYVAPVRQTAEYMSAASDAPVYLYHWAVVSSLDGGARHADNLRYEVRDPDLVKLSPSIAEIAGHNHAYLASFIVSGDPNAIAGDFPDRPVWAPYTAANPKAAIFGKGNTELIGGPVGVATSVEDDVWARDECKFWWSKVDLSQQ